MKVKRRTASLILPVLTEAKVGWYLEMRALRVRKADLARRLGCHMRQVDGLLDLGDASRLDQIAAAFAALHKRVVIEICAAA